MKSLENILPAEEDREEKLKKTSVFLAKLLAVGLVFRAVLYIRPDTTFLQAHLASLTAYLLSLIDVNLEVQGALLVGESSSYIVNQDCLGWKSGFAFVGLMLASTKDLAKDYKFILGGLAAILVLNMLRVVTTVYLSYKNIISFDIIHTVLWRWGLTTIVLILWISWLYGLGSRIKRTFIYRDSEN